MCCEEKKSMEKHPDAISCDSFAKIWKRNISAYRQYRFNRSFLSEFDYRNVYLKRLIHAKGLFQIKQPFYCRYGSHITIGRDFRCGHGAIFDDEGNITIGDHVQIGNDVKVITTKTIHDPQARIKHKVHVGDIAIQHHAYIGNNVTIMAGVTIGACAIIADGSMVCEDVAAGSIVQGSPAAIQEEESKALKALMAQSGVMEGDLSLFERVAAHVDLRNIDTILHAAVIASGAYCGYRIVKDLMAKKVEWDEKKALVEKYMPLLDKLPQGKQVLSKGMALKKKRKG